MVAADGDDALARLEELDLAAAPKETVVIHEVHAPAVVLEECAAPRAVAKLECQPVHHPTLRATHARDTRGGHRGFQCGVHGRQHRIGDGGRELIAIAHKAKRSKPCGAAGV